MSSSNPKNEDYKENFINFLASQTPTDINEFISRNGKPPKLIDPIFYFNSIELNDNQDTNS